MRNNKGRAWLVLGLLVAIAPLPVAHGASPAPGVVGDESGVVGKTMLSPQQEQAGAAAGIATSGVSSAAPKVPVVPEVSTTQADITAAESASASGVVGDEFGQLACGDVPDFAAGIIGK
jgi:hypothetical protein